MLWEVLFFVKLDGDDPNYKILEKYTDDISELPDTRSDEINSDCQNLFVFDVMVDEEKKDLIRIDSYFTKARKRNSSLIFLSRLLLNTYTPIKIRKNCTHLFSQNSTQTSISRTFAEI